jgi:DNA-binding transcriptional ArsR family regulator
MVERSERLSRAFAAVADPTRRAILAHLRQGEATVSELAEPFTVSLAAISKHVAVLERARLIEREVVGREHRLRLVAGGLRDVAAFALDHEALWAERVDALESLLSARGRKRRPQSRTR